MINTLNIEYNVPLNQGRIVYNKATNLKFLNLETINILSLLIFHVTILQHSEEQDVHKRVRTVIEIGEVFSSKE